MKMILLIAILFFASSVMAQPTNVHVAGTISASGNLGFKNPSLGITSGFDYRHKRMAHSGDLSLDKIEKNVGGKGGQLSGRETVRMFFGRLFVQGGASEARYKVTKFSKSVFEPLVGIGYADRSFVVQANYLKDVTSFNHQNVTEGVVTFYLKHHIYVKGATAFDHFKSSKVWMNGVATTIAVGVWK